MTPAFLSNADDAHGRASAVVAGCHGAADAHGRASAATFTDELVQRCQDGKGRMP
ncbi:MAG: hypothetical protein ABRQ26_01745 [Syntrophomonadaceae bacterium]